MNTKALTFTMILSVIAVAVFGTIAYFMTAHQNINGAVFERGDEYVFVEINGSYYGPEAEGKGESSYYLIINRSEEGSYDEEDIDIPAWNIGKTNFTESKNTIELRFKVKNLNPYHALKLDFSEIAYNPKCFSTKYSLSYESDFDLATESYNDLSGQTIKDIQIYSEKTVYISLLYSLTNVNQPFKLNNNLNILMTTIFEN